MILKSLNRLLLGAALAASGLASTGAIAQAKEQFFPLLVYRSGAYAPNGTPWANGKQDYIKMINARDGGVNGVKLTFEECETGYATDRGGRRDQPRRRQRGAEQQAVERLQDHGCLHR